MKGREPRANLRRKPLEELPPRKRRQRSHGSIGIPSDPFVAHRLLHDRTSESGNADDGMSRSSAVANEHHDTPAGNAAVDIDPSVAEISPEVTQSESGLGTHGSWSNELDIWIDN